MTVYLDYFFFQKIIYSRKKKRKAYGIYKNTEINSDSDKISEHSAKNESYTNYNDNLKLGFIWIETYERKAYGC